MRALSGGATSSGVRIDPTPYVMWCKLEVIVLNSQASQLRAELHNVELHFLNLKQSPIFPKLNKYSMLFLTSGTGVGHWDGIEGWCRTTFMVSEPSNLSQPLDSVHWVIKSNQRINNIIIVLGNSTCVGTHEGNMSYSIYIYTYIGCMLGSAP